MAITTETFDWTITEYGDVCDRFATKEEATAELASGGYPAVCKVEYVPDSFPTDEDYDGMYEADDPKLFALKMWAQER